MKRAIVYCVCSVCLITLGFLGGRFVEHIKSGFYYQLHEMKESQSDLGPVQWKLTTETVGFKLMADTTTSIEFDNRIIYRALSNWNEGVPYAANVKASGDSIDWDDGEYQFHLKIQKIKSEQADAPNSHAFGTFVTDPAEAGSAPKASESR